MPSRHPKGTHALSGGSKPWHMRMRGLPRPQPEQCPQRGGLWCWYANAQCMSREVPKLPPPAPPAQKISVKRGDRYAPVDTERLDLGDHQTTLTSPACTPSHRHAHVSKGHLQQDRGGTGPGPLGPGSPATQGRRLEGLKRDLAELHPSPPAGQPHTLQSLGSAGRSSETG